VRVLAERGANAYVYAPKDDPWHRRQWRDPYPADEVAEFHRFATACARRGVRFGVGISPGLDIDYDNSADFHHLTTKLEPLLADDAWVVLALDDIRPDMGLGARQARLASALHDWLCAAHPTGRVSLVPTEYIGTRPSSYLDELATGLPPDVDVMWTGRTVCSPAMTALEARARADTLGGRIPLVWDNYPVNDALLANALHLAPYAGREPALVGASAGVLLNPMTQARASLVPLLTALAFWCDPDGYEPMTAWRDALHAVGGDRAAAWRTLGEACWSSPLHAPNTVPLARLLDDDTTSADTWRVVAAAATALPAAFADDGAAAEVMPWVEQVAREGSVINAAVRLRETVEQSPLDRGRATARAFVLLGAWTQARTASTLVAYGPRFAAAPALDGDRLDVRAAITEDASAVDRLARRTLDAYEAATK
jgi:hyaluronoglucosaminidase